MGIDLIIGHDLFMKFKNLKDPAGNFNPPSTDEQVSAEKCSSVAVVTRAKDYEAGVINNKSDSNGQMVGVPPSSECDESVNNVTEPSIIDPSNKHKDKYKIAQIEDPSLSDAWTKAKQGHPGYVIHKRLLFKRQMIYDFD